MESQKSVVDLNDEELSSFSSQESYTSRKSLSNKIRFEIIVFIVNK